MAKIKKLSKKNTIIVVIIAVILALAVAGGIYCIATSQNPVQAVRSAVTSGDEKLIGKWQNQSNPGLNAYVFNEDGTYDSYLSTVSFSGNYEVSGNKLTLRNPTTNKDIVYKFSVTEKELSLTLIEEDGEETEEKDVTKFDKVEELHQKSLSDLLSDLTTTSADTQE